MSFRKRTERRREPQRGLELAVPELGLSANILPFRLTTTTLHWRQNQTLKMEDFLYMLHDDGDIDDEELLLLMPIHSRNLHVGLPYSSYDRFDLVGMRDDECEVEFRFKKEDIFRLAAALPLPNTFKCQNGVVVDDVEALCIALKRFAYPCRYVDLIPRFGRPVSQLCMVSNLVVDHIIDRFGYLLASLEQPWLLRHYLQLFAAAIHNKGAA